jgi:replicative superfamily II helicase
MLGPSITGILPWTPEGMQSRLEYSFHYEPYNTVVSEVHRVPAEGNEFDRLARLCKSLNGPTIIFCQSPPRAANVAKALIERGVGETRTEVSHAVDWIGREYHPDWHFTRALSEGIGVHHGRIPRGLAQYIVRAFDSDKIKYLICTSTLIEGVNTKAENIIIFDNKINR